MPSVAHPLLAASLSGHDSFVEGVEFSSNGKYIMSSSSGKLILSHDGRDAFFICCACEVLRA